MIGRSENLSQMLNTGAAKSRRVAVLLTGYGGIQNYQDFTEYNKRASEYVAAKFAPIPEWHTIECRKN